MILDIRARRTGKTWDIIKHAYEHQGAAIIVATYVDKERVLAESHKIGFPLPQYKVVSCQNPHGMKGSGFTEVLVDDLDRVLATVLGVCPTYATASNIEIAPEQFTLKEIADAEETRQHRINHSVAERSREVPEDEADFAYRITHGPGTSR